jgi:hypothetical protein
MHGSHPPLDPATDHLQRRRLRRIPRPRDAAAHVLRRIPVPGRRPSGHDDDPGPDPDARRSAEPGPATYLLVHDRMADSGHVHERGWELQAWNGRVRSWSVTLAARGAGHGAPARVAQAVAVRVLGERDVVVRAWHPCGADHVPVFLAGVGPARRRAVPGRGARR